jgi:hypothetical protein
MRNNKLTSQISSSFFPTKKNIKHKERYYRQARVHEAN